MKRYIYDPVRLIYREVDEPRIYQVLRIFAGLVAAVLLVVFYYWFYTSVLDLELPKTALLRANNVRMHSRMDVLERQIDLYESTLETIELRDDAVYRSIFGLDTVSLAADNGYNLEDRIDNMSRRAVVQSIALDEIYDVAEQAGDMVTHVPAVPPINPIEGSYRISSYFGTRIDPVYGRRAFHEGQDFAAKVGKPVYCTADGVVEVARVQHNGYGNEVVVNHGFGYKTRYAHLKSFDVAPGMKIKRGELIGRVGSSGKSTGPHLHYEVIYKDKRVNPINFMDLSISPEEYDAMTHQSMIDSDRETGVKPTTTELIRRRR